ncbi:MAG TPA: hypothetical protein DD384_05085 [Firmicutes bacterium]|nr:hypothetical protein [Bacillota bacterium]
MEEKSIRLGSIPKKVTQLFHLKGNVDIVVWNKTLDGFARRYPKDYLVKIAECKRILANPLYASYDQKQGILYIVKEYIIGGTFKKVALAINLKEANLIDFFLLTPAKIKEIFHEEMRWKLVTLTKK